MKFQHLQFELKDKLGILTFNRLRVLNALNSEVLRELKNFLQDIKTIEIHSLIITGAGKSFVAGADLKEMLHFNPDQARDFSKKGQKVLLSIESLPFPVIGAVNGFALGGGLELALACDILLLSAGARLGLPEVSLGLLPAFGGTQRLPRAVGMYKAKEMIYSGRVYTAEEVFSMGLGNKILPEGELMLEARRMASEIRTRNFEALAKSKKLLQEMDQATLENRLDEESKAFSQLFKSEDAKKLLQKFLEKRTAPLKDV